ncbi:MAG: hypothetical protein H6713_29505 [Myxococcales bacterium]|nr:hypothetical protein [Myxococcales bacterium]MCB9754099.1 hypothetical protein [Myxococcales bacterium]
MGARRRALAHVAGDRLALNGNGDYSGGVVAPRDLSVPIRVFQGGVQPFKNELTPVGEELSRLRSAIDALAEQLATAQLSASIRAEAPHYTQEGWRYCSKCAGLSFAPNRARGVCPADKQPHAVESGACVLFAHRSQYAGQPGWAWCHKCQVLCHGTAALSGSCPAGGAHDRSRSPAFFLWSAGLSQANKKARDFPVQEGWRWCGRCYGLVLGTPSPGRCPHPDGGAHSTSEQNLNYGVMYPA